MWDGEHTIYVYDPERKSLNALPPATGPAPSHGNKGRVYSQWFYLPEKNVFLGISPSEGIWLWRPERNLTVGPADTVAHTQTPLTSNSSEEQIGASEQDRVSGPSSTAGMIAQAQPVPAAGPSEQQATADERTPSPGPLANTSFADLCARPETLLCDPMDDTPISGPFITSNTKNLTMSETIAGHYRDWRWAWTKRNSITPQLDTRVKADGQGSLKFTIASQSGSGGASLYTVDVDPNHNLSSGVGVGQSLRVRFKVRWSCDVLFIDCNPSSPTYEQERRHYAVKFGHGGIKIFGIMEGDRPNQYLDTMDGLGGPITSNFGQKGIYGAYIETWYSGIVAPGSIINGVRPLNAQPGGDHQCWTKDPTTGASLTEAWPECKLMKADQWVTVQADLFYGGCTVNSADAAKRSHFTLWVADQSQPFDLITDADINIRCSPKHPEATFGKIWFSPFNTGKDPTEVHPVGYVWYDSLWVSKITH
jgi:hypothetical protein